MNTQLEDIKLPTNGGVVNRMSYLLTTGFQSDCSFIVGDGQNLEEFQAHRLILGTSSPVFKAMMYGPLAEKGIIKIIDITPDAFQVLLEYIYTDSTSLNNLEQACGVLYAACKYLLPELSKYCVNFISSNIATQHVCAVLELARSLGVTELIPICIKLICKNGDEILSSNEMLRLSGPTVCTLLMCDDLQVEDESVVFSAVQRWARAQTYSNNTTSDNSSDDEPTAGSCLEIRNILRSSGILALIRFLTMNVKQFSNGPDSPINSGLLTQLEIKAILARITPNSPVSGSTTPTLPACISHQTRHRIKLPMPLKRPPGSAVRRRTVKSSQLMRHIISNASFVMEFSTSDNIILTGISFCTQIPGIEEYVRGRPSPPDVYTEELIIQIVYNQGQGEIFDILHKDNFKSILPYNGVATIALSNPIQLTRGKGYSIMITLLRGGDYPLSILSRREFHSGIGFRFDDFAQTEYNKKFAQDLGFIVGIVYLEA